MNDHILDRIDAALARLPDTTGIGGILADAYSMIALLTKQVKDMEKSNDTPT